jgi:hypothetical protein
MDYFSHPYFLFVSPSSQLCQPLMRARAFTARLLLLPNEACACALPLITHYADLHIKGRLGLSLSLSVSQFN